MTTTSKTALALALGLGLAAPASAQQETPMFLVPGPDGQEYVLILTPRTPDMDARGARRSESQGRRGGFEDRQDSARAEFSRQLYEHGYAQGQRDARRQFEGAMDQQEDAGPSARDAFERGRQIGRFEEQMRRAGQDDRAMRQVRASVRDARRALDRDETEQARAALDEVDRMLRARGGRREELRDALDEAERALREGDRQGAEEALRRAREASEGQEQEQEQAEAGSQRGQDQPGQQQGEQIPQNAAGQPGQQGSQTRDDGQGQSTQN